MKGRKKEEFYIRKKSLKYFKSKEEDQKRNEMK
jgi:hypothetical protein